MEDIGVRSLKGIFLALLLIGCFLAVGFSNAERSAAQSPTASPTATLDTQKVLDAANQANKDAEQAVNNANQAMGTINLLLSFIQVFGLIVTIFTTIAAVFGISSITQFRQSVEEKLASRAAEIEQAQTELRTEEKRLFEAMQEARQGAEARVAELAGQVRQVHEESTRAVHAFTLMQLGEQQLELNNLQGARKLYESALAIDPNNQAINYFLGELLLHNLEIDRGLELLQKAHQLAQEYDPKGAHYAPVEAAIGYGLRLKAEHTADEADRELLFAQSVKQLRKALEIDPNVLNLRRESFYGSLGGLYKRRGKYEQAIESYERAHEITPASSYPVINLANLHYRQGNLEQARDYYAQSERNAEIKLTRNPRDKWTRLNRVVARIVLDNLSGAQDDLDEVMRLATQGEIGQEDMERILSDMDMLLGSPKPPHELEQFRSKLQALRDHIKTN
jgi:tetratricopeptide (TPR) repeat protein